MTRNIVEIQGHPYVVTNNIWSDVIGVRYTNNTNKKWYELIGVKYGNNKISTH